MTKYEIVLFITTLIIISTVYAEKFRFCAVDGRKNLKRVSRYCPALSSPDSKVQCVVGVDRLDCLRKISKKQADFAVFTSEDLVTASNSNIELLVTNELRYSDVKYEYEIVAVVDKKTGIQSRHDLQDKRFCHPGYGYQTDWTRILSNYLEASVVPQNCEPNTTLAENRIKSSSEFFGSACKAGPWVTNDTLDYELKRKYPNLCAACDTPAKCSKEDKYWGRRGSLFCLTDNSGDISWARWDDVQVHFGLVPGGTEASPEGYSLLCPDDTMKPVNTTNPCVWLVKPWSVVATDRTKAEDIQTIISALSHDDNHSWQSALLNLMESYHLSVKPLKPVDPIETYLAKATGFLSANSFSGCHPPRTIRICTTSIVENSKCVWLREAMESYGIEPSLDCLKSDNTTLCMDAVQKNFADVVMISPDSLNEAQTKYKLQTLFHETVNDDFKYTTVAVTKKNKDFDSLEDLKGAKACFPKYDGVAWNSVAHYLNRDNLLESCPVVRGMAKFFKEICVSGLPENEDNFLVSPGCKTNVTEGDEGAIECLLEDVGEVAFISKNNLMSFLADSKRNKNNLTLADFKIVCEKSAGESCFLSWAPVGHAMIRRNASQLWIRDALDVFFAIDDNFGKSYTSLTTAFTLFGRFNGNSNLLFHDATVRLRSQPTVRNIDQMPKVYDEILKNQTDCKSSSGAPNILSVFYILIFTYLAKSFVDMWR